MRKLFLTALVGIGLGIGLAQAEEVIVRTRPPAVIVEKRGIAPSGAHVWITGYHRWDGHAYVWVPGRWDLAPRPHAVWVPHHWAHRRGGWVLIEGHWR